MAAELIVSVSGIRGLVGVSLHPEDAMAFAQALGTWARGPIAVSRDGRPSGGMLAAAVTAGLQSVGCSVMDLRICPTPTVGVAVRTLRIAGAIQITASHNPAEWNGLKLFDHRGCVLPPDQGKEVLAISTAAKFHRPDYRGIGGSHAAGIPGDPNHWHALRVLAHTDLEIIERQHFRVLVDGNGGSGGPLAKLLLRLLGCEIVEVNTVQDGIFRHPPEPTPEHLRDVAALVAKERCQIGFALDPDADRLALIDETGTCLSEELTLALAVQYRLMRMPGPIVINLSTSRVTQDVATRLGQTCYRAAVGEANVVKLMMEKDAVIGGEGNGGVIDPRVGWVRDPYVGMAAILGLMAETGEPLSRLAAALPKYVIRKDKFTIDRARLPQLYDTLRKQHPEATADTTDGLRLDWDNRWVHLRPSNTEPIVRAIAEAPDAATANQLCSTVAEAIG